MASLQTFIHIGNKYMHMKQNNQVIMQLKCSILRVLIILHLAEQITNGSTGFATDKCNRFITFNIT